MGYSAKNGRKPFERASKISHAEIINNPDVAAFLQGCTVPSASAAVGFEALTHQVQPADTSHVRIVVAVDGGFTETPIREEFPFASITFFTFGPLLFKLDDLRDLDTRRFIAPEDLAALKQIQRYTLTLPTRGVRMSGEPSLAASIRRTIHDFFTKRHSPGEDPLIETLRWFIFRRWQAPPDDTREEKVSRCPNPACSGRDLAFTFGGPAIYACPTCGQPVYLTDVFRLHELVDEEQGAAGVQPYLMTLLEHMVLLDTIRTVLAIKRSLLGEILFLKDGPLAFFGQVAPLFKPMRDLFRHLMQQPDSEGGTRSLLYMAGAEKSGAFVEHAHAIEEHLSPSTYVLPDNDYIYRYIVPGDPRTSTYGHNTYVGGKVLYKSVYGDMHVLTVPNLDYTPTPRPADFPNLDAILTLVGELRCSMYDNALIPIALANKLVSLSDVPSQRILTTFARQAIG